MRAAKVQASLRIRAVSPEPSLLAHTSSESRGTFRQKTRSLAPLNGWACAQSRQNLRRSLIQAVSQEEPSDRKPDLWPL